MTTTSAAAASRLWPALGGWALFIAVETVTQVVMKLAGEHLEDGRGVLEMAANAAAAPITWLAFALYFAGFVIWLTILKDADMGRAFPMTATIYLATLTAAVVLFHEHLNPVRILGVIAIVGGVGLLASDANSAKPDGPGG